MRITREADYALRITAELSAEKNRLDARVIAERNGIPYRFTLKILRKMVQAGIVKSYRGVGGGYAIANDPSQITLKDVIEAIDGKTAINICLENPENCGNSAVCNVRKNLYEVQKKLEGEMAKITFRDIIEGHEANA